MFGYKRKNIDLENNILKLKKWLDESDAVVLGAGAGLSTATGFIYTGD